MTALRQALVVLALAEAVSAGPNCDMLQGPTGEQLNGPSAYDQTTVNAWMASMRDMRTKCRAEIAYNGSIYEQRALAWTQTTFMQPQMHPYDRFFYDPAKAKAKAQGGGYTVGRYLQDLNDRYGGIDSALVWPTYTNIGTDDRSQFDLITSMPGGIEAITAFGKQMHAAGVKVLWPYNPWDTGTRRDAQGRTDAQLLAWLSNATDTDGFNGDTMGSVPESFWQASLDVRHPEAIEPEGGGSDESLNWDTMGWGYWQYPQAPAVSKWKWIEPRFLTNVCDRWNKNKTDNLQFAWFNGAGYETWENVWGTWNGIVPADGEAIRRVGTMLRFFGARAFTVSPDWTPHVPTQQPGAIFATKFPKAATGEALWTLVNRGGYNSTGAQLKLGASERAAHYYDCYHGTELQVGADGALSFDIEAEGYGCVLATPNSTASDAALAAFLRSMSAMSARPLASYRKAWEYLLQEMVPSPPTRASAAPPAGMVRAPGGVYRWASTGVEIEGDTHTTGVDIQAAYDGITFEMRPSKIHEQFLTMDDFDIDEYPVTVDQYAAYLADSGYLPSNAHNWLKDDSWTWPAGKGPVVGPYGHGPATVAPAVASGAGDRPVVHVSMEEARAYCAHYGKRLPQAIEWQYAAQGGDSTRLFPWGNDMDQTKFPKLVDDSTTVPPRASVHAFDGANASSPFGMRDVVGNVWQYTSEVRDAHTRGVVLRGAANYRPKQSMWYFPQALQLNQHNKYFLMDDSYERAGTIGFRCAADAPASAPAAQRKDCAPGAATPLCARLGPTPAYVDLTAVAGASGDWVHFGDASDFAPTRKAAAAPPRLGNLTACDGCAAFAQFTNNANAFSWSDGPAGSNLSAVSNTTTGVYTSAAGGNAGSISLVATAGAGEIATLTVFVGSYDTDAVFTATLASTGAGNGAGGDGDGSYKQVLTGASSGVAHNQAFTLRFAGPAALTTTWGVVPPAPTPAPTPCAGTMCALPPVAVSPCGDATVGDVEVNLSAEGTLDWVHWGLGAAGVARKAAAKAVIGDYVVIGADAKDVATYQNNQVGYSWHDGAAGTTVATKTPTGVFVTGKGKGFSVTVPVDAASTTRVKIFVGAYAGAGTITATLSDGSTAPISQSMEPCNGGTGNMAYEFVIKGAKAGSTVNLKWVQSTDGGNVTLQAIAVSSSALLTAGATGGAHSSGGNINFQAAVVAIEKQMT